MDLTLEQLLASLSTGLDKSASDKEDEKEDKDEKEDDKPAFLKEKGEKSEKEDKKDKDDEDDEKSDEGQTKEASAQGAALAREIMEKVAGLNLESVTGMQKTASSAGKTLAQALIQKLASAGDTVTEAGIPEGVVPNKNQVDNAQMKAEDDAKVKPMPTSDGLRPTGTINEIFDAIVADAMSQGAASTDQVHDTGVAKNEGAVEDHALPNQVKSASAQLLLGAGKKKMGTGTKAALVGLGSAAAATGIAAGAKVVGAGGLYGKKKMSEKKAEAMTELLESGIDFDQAAEMVKQASAELEDQFEKAAAVDHLVENGVDFNDAVELVKQAAAEIAAEEFGMAKAAALKEMLEEGVDFDQAIELIKQASAGDMVTSDGVYEGAVPNKNQVDNAQMHAEGASYIKPMLTSDGTRPTGTINEIFDAVIQDAISQGAASTDQVHETGVAKVEGAVEDHALPNQVKTAALNKLMESGVDFEKAAQIVKEAAGRAMTLHPNVINGTAKEVFPLAKRPGGLGGMLSRMPRAAKLGLAGAAAAGAVGAGAAAMRSPQEKKAEAMSLLLEQGVDFDQATEMVKQASAKLGV